MCKVCRLKVHVGLLELLPPDSFYMRYICILLTNQLNNRLTNLTAGTTILSPMTLSSPF
jgi:hypothetical protein